MNLPETEDTVFYCPVGVVLITCPYCGRKFAVLAYLPKQDQWLTQVPTGHRDFFCYACGARISEDKKKPGLIKRIGQWLDKMLHKLSKGHGLYPGEFP
nr:hypothetical protein 3 [Dehalococcoidia bacterium]